MELSISIEELRKRKLFLAVPMYGGVNAGMFAKSLSDLTTACIQHGIQMKHYFLFNESLIPRARNYCVDEFLRSDSTHFMFIDADIGFNANDVITMLAMMSDESEYDVLAGPYPKKCISWEKIKLAVDKGIADEDPNVLERFVGDYVFNPKANNGRIPISEPVEVLEAGTGFMMIRRKTFEKFSEAYPEYQYRPDHVRTEHFDGKRQIGMFFQAEIDVYNPIKDFRSILERMSGGEVVSSEEAFQCLSEADQRVNGSTRRYLSEDYWFSQKIQEIGLKVWFCPWMQLQHVGTYIFGGSLADLAAIGANATADMSELKKNK